MTKKPPSKRTGDSSRLGAYLLPGRIKDPLDAIIQAEAGERIGLGTMWVSERWGNKDIGAICGAVTQVAPSATRVGSYSSAHTTIGLRIISSCAYHIANWGF